MNRWVPNILEGTDAYSLFRAFSITMFFVIAAIMLINVDQVRTNRETGYHNRAVSCAVLHAKITELDAENIHDAIGHYVWDNSCQNENVKEKYAAR